MRARADHQTTGFPRRTSAVIDDRVRNRQLRR
jgi:hypothetical protein